jgi:hypothetical protein
MAMTLWSFLLRGDGSFTKYPQKRYDRFLHGEQSLGDDPGTVAHFIDVAVVVQDRQPVQAIRFWYPRYRLSKDGRVNSEHLEQAMVDAVDATFIAFEKSVADIISIAPYVARNRHQMEHTWKPSPEQLDAATRAINTAAKLELVTHDGDRLLWVDHGFRP